MCYFGLGYINPNKTQMCFVCVYNAAWRGHKAWERKMTLFTFTLHNLRLWDMIILSFLEIEKKKKTVNVLGNRNYTGEIRRWGVLSCPTKDKHERVRRLEIQWHKEMNRFLLFFQLTFKREAHVGGVGPLCRCQAASGIAFPDILGGSSLNFDAGDPCPWMLKPGAALQQKVSVYILSTAACTILAVLSQLKWSLEPCRAQPLCLEHIFSHNDIIGDAISLFTLSLLPWGHYIAYKLDNQEQVCVWDSNVCVWGGKLQKSIFCF